MQFSVSNIGWTQQQDSEVYAAMQALGFTGLEIAPTRIFPEAPYEKLSQARQWAEALPFTVPSMQSIWYGRQEKLFGSEDQRQSLIDYTKKAIDFAEVAGCRNLVFGCPRNRYLPDPGLAPAGAAFFKLLGDYAHAHHTCIGMEANPPIYHTNYICDTPSALALIQAVDSPGFRLNLDLGTMIENGESPDLLRGKVSQISHVHISEPNLQPIVPRQLHREIRDLLAEEGYQGFVSIEMGRQPELQPLLQAMAYVKDLFAF